MSHQSHRHRIEQRRATRGSQASPASTNGNQRLPHLKALCRFSALLQSLLINAHIAIQSNLIKISLPNNTLDKVELTSNVIERTTLITPITLTSHWTAPSYKREPGESGSTNGTLPSFPPHSLCCFSALLQFLLINTDLSMQNNIKRCISISKSLVNNVNLETSSFIRITLQW